MSTAVQKPAEPLSAHRTQPSGSHWVWRLIQSLLRSQANSATEASLGATPYIWASELHVPNSHTMKSGFLWTMRQSLGSRAGFAAPGLSNAQSCSEPTTVCRRDTCVPPLPILSPQHCVEGILVCLPSPLAFSSFGLRVCVR